MQYKESNKIENILAKAKELEQDVSNIHFKDCNENNVDFNKIEMNNCKINESRCIQSKFIKGYFTNIEI